MSALDENVERAGREDRPREIADVIERGDLTDVDATQCRRFVEIGRHDLCEGEECLAIRLNAAVTHQDVSAGGDQNGIDNQVRKKALTSQDGHSPYRGGAGQHARLDGANLEVVDDGANLSLNEVRIDLSDSAHAARVLGGERGEGRRGKDAEGVEGTDVGLDARPAA
jgi:hypothetical protein